MLLKLIELKKFYNNDLVDISGFILDVNIINNDSSNHFSKNVVIMDNYDTSVILYLCRHDIDKITYLNRYQPITISYVCIINIKNCISLQLSANSEINIIDEYINTDCYNLNGIVCLTVSNTVCNNYVVCNSISQIIDNKSSYKFSIVAKLIKIEDLTFKFCCSIGCSNTRMDIDSVCTSCVKQNYKQILLVLIVVKDMFGFELPIICENDDVVHKIILNGLICQNLNFEIIRTKNINGLTKYKCLNFFRD